MKRFIVSLSVVVCVLGIAGLQESFALDFGGEITISDLVYDGTGWYSNREDQETEPGTVTDQSWDLEGFFLKETSLTMIGGYDFEHGNGDIYSGDIFLDVTGDVVYGPDNDGSGYNYSTVNNSFGFCCLF